MNRTILLYTCKHLGDYAVLTNTVYNLKQAYPEHDYQIDYRGYIGYSDLFLNNPLVCTHGRYPEWKLYTNYGGRHYESSGEWGAYANGFHRMAQISFTALYGEKKVHPMLKKTPDFYILPEEYENYKIPYENYCIVNNNYQTSADVKGYPYFQQVIDQCKDMQFLQIGGDHRDISATLHGAIDLRGKTTVRQLLLLASKAKCILSGPSGIIHLGAPFTNVKKIVIIGAREPTTLWQDYENTTILTSSCGQWGGSRGCMAMHFRSDMCTKYIQKDGRQFPHCMAAIDPDRIVEELCKV